jgi:flagellar basal-body rod modification protein FlgD
VSAIPSLDGLNTTTAGSASNNNALNTEDFLKIMITELTNQDPFEPMKNQDLINQMAGIQQIQASKNTTDTFKAISGKFDELMGQLGSFVDRERLSSTTKMIGQTISGTTINGRFAVGKVMAVNVEGSNVLLEIDTGELINMNDMQRLGGANSQDIIGTLVAGKNGQGEDTVGVVESVETDGQQVILQLESGEEIALSQATIITEDTAYLLLGLFVEGSGDTQGYVDSYRIGSEPGIAGITLVLDTGQELPLTAVANIRITENEEE